MYSVDFHGEEYIQNPGRNKNEGKNVLRIDTQRAYDLDCGSCFLRREKRWHANGNTPRFDHEFGRGPPGVCALGNHSTGDTPHVITN